MKSPSGPLTFQAIYVIGEGSERNYGQGLLHHTYWLVRIADGEEVIARVRFSGSLEPEELGHRVEQLNVALGQAHEAARVPYDASKEIRLDITNAARQDRDLAYKAAFNAFSMS